VFEGPLDLLLHLIKKNEVESSTSDRRNHRAVPRLLEMMQQLNLDVAGGSW